MPFVDYIDAATIFIVRLRTVTIITSLVLTVILSIISLFMLSNEVESFSFQGLHDTRLRSFKRGIKSE